ncbi:MAG: Dipeptidyl aminopeptidase/acylaminoacyl-peptidase [Acidobacteria bacterium]|nr:Dipeptidyl aminopeptidase/acylaminoacyl-peptidase [Acidobacteriota bacterium]
MNNFRRSLYALVFLLSISLTTLGQQKQLTIDDIFDPAKKVNFGGSVPTIKWLQDGVHYLQTNDPSKHLPRIQKVNALTGEAVPFFDAAKMQVAFSSIPGITPQQAKQLSGRGSYQLNPTESAVLINFANDVFYYELGSNKAARLTNNPEEEVGEMFSPDGRMVSFVRNNNIYVLDLSTERERRLTIDGSPKILNGRLDWVYQEELYGRGNFEGYWWSPDSTMIAYLHLDEHPVPDYTVVDHIPLEQNVEVTPYPKAGDPNPIVSLGLVDAAGGTPRWIDTYKYQPSDFLIARVAWSGDGKKVVYQAQNREQTFLDLNAADPKDGKSTTLIHETSKAWVEVIDNPAWLKDGSFIWQSERDGWRHLYHYAADGQLLRQVTKGDWEVRSFEGVNENKGLIYFAASEHSNIGPQAYRIKLDGTGLTRLSNTEGSHRVNFSPDFAHFVDVWSDVNNPSQERLYDVDGKLVRVIDDNKAEALKQYQLGATELLQVKTRDGFPMDAQIIRPPNFDPKKKYPVMSFTYSGPHSPSVRNTWGGSVYLWHQMLAQKGYIVWICDNRTASGRGLGPTWMAYKNLGELELRDLEDGYSWLKSQPYVDGSRIGLWGWSYGGFMTSYALTHSQTFKLGIAGGTVSDWRNYDSIYTERVMLTPQNNLDGYKKSGPVFAAKDLHGKLLLIHGAIDDNVHMSNTIQFVYELQKAGKQFELMLYPKSRHGVTDPVLVKHMRQMMMDFILENL